METLVLVFLLAFIAALTFGLGFADDLLERRNRIREVREKMYKDKEKGPSP